MSGTHFLDHLDLLVADRGEHDRELGLLFDRSRSGARSGRHGDRGRGRHAPLLFEHLGELSRFEHGEAREIVDDFLQISHRLRPYRFEPVEFAKGLHAASLLLA